MKLIGSPASPEGHEGWAWGAWGGCRESHGHGHHRPDPGLKLDADMSGGGWKLCSRSTCNGFNGSDNSSMEIHGDPRR